MTEHCWEYMEQSIVQYCIYCGANWQFRFSIDGKSPPKCEPEKYGPHYENGKYVGREVRDAQA